MWRACMAEYAVDHSMIQRVAARRQPAVFASFLIRVGGIGGRWEQKGESLNIAIVKKLRILA